MKLKFTLLFLVLFGMSSIGAWAQTTHTVCASGCDFTTIQAAISAAAPGDIIAVSEGTYMLAQQLVIDKNLTLTGAGKATTFLKADMNLTGGSATDPGLIKVNTGVTFNFSGFTVDGNYPTNKVRMGLVTYGTGGTIQNNEFKNISLDASWYDGRGVVVFGTDVTISNNTFINIGRIGIHVRKAYSGTQVATNILVAGNTYTGKGTGDKLDYGVEVGAAASATVSSNNISECKGVTSNDGSTSAGILATDYYGTGTVVTISSNTIHDNIVGIAMGYAAADATTATISGNTFNNHTENNLQFTENINANLDAIFAGNTFDRCAVVTDGTNILPGTTFHTTIQDAIAAAAAGNLIKVAAGTYEFTAQMNLDKDGLSITGVGNVIFQANNASWSTVNGYKHLIGIYAGEEASPVTISNITMNCNSQCFGVNVYSNAYGVFNSVTINGGKGAGLTVNGSTIIATNLNTATNAWGAVNVDPGSGVTTPSVFTLNSGTLAENIQIWSDGSHVTGSATVTVNATGYNKYNVGTTKIWTNRALANCATITKDGETTIYNTIQAAINAAVAGDVINVAQGTYNECLNISKSLSVIGYEADPSLVQINAGGLNGYGSPLSGIYSTQPNVVLKGITLNGGGQATSTQPRYGINISGTNGAILQHIVVKNFSRSGVNVPGCSNMTFDYITATDNGGNGIGLRDVSNSTISNITTNNNLWGGLRVQTYYGTISGIVINGTNSFGEDGSAPLYLHPFFLEQGNVSAAGPVFPISYGYSGSPDVLIQATDFAYILSGDDDEAPQYQRIHFYKTQSNVIAAAAAPVGTYAYHITTHRFVKEIATGHFFVASPLTITNAIYNAINGDVIDVAAGTFNEFLTVNKSLTINGANAGIHPAVGTHPTEVVGTRGAETILNSLSPAADNIVVDGIHFLKAGTRMIDTYSNANNFVMRNCIVESTTFGATTGVVQFGGGSHTGCLFEFNLFKDKGDHTFYAGGGPYDGLTFQYNKFNVEGDAIFWAATPLVNGVFLGNEFDGTIGGTPGVGYCTVNIGQAGNVQITDNYVHDVMYTAFQVGIIDGSITGNTFQRTYPLSGYWASAFELWGGQWGTAVSSNVTITGNTFYYNDIAGAAYPSHGLRLRAPETGSGIDGATIHVSDNKFMDGGVRSDAKALRHQGNQNTSVDADLNYWGSATPNFASILQGPANVCPWYTDESLTTTAGAVHNVTQNLFYCTIQSAIDASAAGDVIEVSAGTYNYVSEGSPAPSGLIKVTKGVTLKAAAGARPVIDGSGFDGVFKIHPSALLPGNTVKIEGFEITGNEVTGIAMTMQGCFNVTPAHVIINDNWFHGMVGGIDFWGAGAYLPSGWTSALANIEITNNKFYDMVTSDSDQGFGIMIEDPANWATAGNDYAVKVTGNEFSNLPSNGANPGFGIVIPRANNVWEAANVFVSGNTFASDVAIGIAIMDGDVTDATIEHNAFGNSLYGVMASGIDNGPVNATCNWWGTTDYNGILAKVNGDVEFVNYLVTSNIVTPVCTGDVWPVHNVTQNLYYTTIQPAITAAAAGDVITVAEGTYTEQLHITTNNLTIEGASKSTVTVKAPASVPLYFTTGTNPNHPVVFVDGVNQFTMSNVTIDGDGKGNANYRFQGIGFWNSGGTLTNVDVYNIIDTPFSGAQHGVAVYAHNNTNGPYTLTCTNMVIDDYQKNAMALSGTGLTIDLDNITTIGAGPTSVTAQNGIQVAYGTSGTITNSNVSGNIYSGSGWSAAGILLYQSGNVDISNTTVTDNYVGIDVNDSDGSISNSTVTNQNSATFDGIYLRKTLNTPMNFDLTGVTVTGHNKADSWGVMVRANAGQINSSINQCQITHWDLGVYTREYTSGIVNVFTNDNVISDNTLGYDANTITPQDATENYWGGCPTVNRNATYFPYYTTVSGTPGSFVFGGQIDNITASAASSSICAGSSTTIYATGGSEYLWDNGLGLGASKVVSPAATTTYSVTSKDANGCTGAFASVTVTVAPAPTVTIDGPTVVALGGTVTLTASGASSYAWSNGATTAVINVSPTSATTYSVTGTTGTCSGTASHTVTVASVDAGANQFICNGGSVTLAVTCNGFIQDSCRWEPGGMKTASVTVSPTVTTTYTVTVNGTLTDQVTVYVRPKPIANAGPDITIASGGNGTLTGSASAGTAPYSYSWTGPSEFTSTAQSPTVSAAGTYILTVTDAYGCTSSTDQAVVTVAASGYTVSGNVSYNNLLNPQMHNVTLTLKQGTTTMYTAVTPATGMGNYQFLGVADGTYTVHFSLPTAWGGVTSADIIAIQNHYKPVNATPLIGLKRLAADVIDNSDLAIVLANDRNQVNAKRLNPNGVTFATGNWVFVKDTDVSANTNPLTYANSAGTSNIIIEVDGGAVTQNFKSLCYGDVDASYSGYKDEENVVNLADGNGLELSNFPNPFSRTTTIRYTVPVESKVTITIHDLLGNRIATIADPDNYEGIHDMPFNADGLAPGVYLYTVRLDTGDDQLMQTGKMIINR